VLRQDAGQLVVDQRLEIACRRQVPRASIAPGKRAVRDLLDQPLHEAILAALRGARIVVEHHQLALHQVPQMALDVVQRHAGDGC